MGTQAPKPLGGGNRPVAAAAASERPAPGKPTVGASSSSQPKPTRPHPAEAAATLAAPATEALSGQQLVGRPEKLPAEPSVQEGATSAGGSAPPAAHDGPATAARLAPQSAAHLSAKAPAREGEPPIVAARGPPEAAVGVPKGPASGPARKPGSSAAKAAAPSGLPAKKGQPAVPKAVASQPAGAPRPAGGLPAPPVQGSGVVDGRVQSGERCRALLIKGLTRPFSDADIRELLEGFGEFTLAVPFDAFWRVCNGM